MSNTEDIAVLSSIQTTLQQNPASTQRDLAKGTNLSLGMVNAVLKKFIERGWIAVSHINAHKISYMLTAEGLKQTATRTTGFIKRNFNIMQDYSNSIACYLQNVKDKGYNAVCVAGNTAAYFVIEYQCQCLDMGCFMTEDITSLSAMDSIIIGETIDEAKQQSLLELGAVKLLDIVQNQNTDNGEPQ